MTLSLTFPGQGSQAVGMGKALAEAYPAARAVFEEVDDALGEALSELIFDGDPDELTLTKNTQPALMCVSLAAFRVLEQEGLDLAEDVSHVAGHSLGEYSALAAAGSISISDAAKLLRMRGRAMQEAVPVGEGAMAAILGLEVAAVEEIVEKAGQGGVCDVANDNANGQVVVSGHKGAVERAIEIAKSSGAKRGLLLPVSAPFHCRLMEPAADVMAEALAMVAVKEPAVPLVANVRAFPVTKPTEIRAGLIAQVPGRVRWRESMEWMIENGVAKQIEVGAGKVLTGIFKRMSKEVSATAFGTPQDLEAAKALFS
ncbi:MAG: ACP S-malonyltransferase [Pseudomonadota bacterium]